MTTSDCPDSARFKRHHAVRTLPRAAAAAAGVAGAAMVAAAVAHATPPERPAAPEPYVAALPLEQRPEMAPPPRIGFLPLAMGVAMFTREPAHQRHASR